MKLKFKIKGLDCVNCANALEEKIGKIEEVNSVSISFMTERMHVEAKKIDIEELVKKIETVVKKNEPDVTITLQ